MISLTIFPPLPGYSVTGFRYRVPLAGYRVAPDVGATQLAHRLHRNHDSCMNLRARHKLVLLIASPRRFKTAFHHSHPHPGYACDRIRRLRPILHLRDQVCFLAPSELAPATLSVIQGMMLHLLPFSIVFVSEMSARLLDCAARIAHCAALHTFDRTRLAA